MDLTEGVTNEDEPSTFLLTRRGIALRELGMHDASREAFKEALRLRSRPVELRHRALVERAGTYLAQGKAGMARKDLEKGLRREQQVPRSTRGPGGTAGVGSAGESHPRTFCGREYRTCGNQKEPAFPGVGEPALSTVQ